MRFILLISMLLIPAGLFGQSNHVFVVEASNDKELASFGPAAAGLPLFETTKRGNNIYRVYVTAAEESAGWAAYAKQAAGKAKARATRGDFDKRLSKFDRAVLITLTGYINELRAVHGQPPKTKAQVKADIKSNLP